MTRRPDIVRYQRADGTVDDGVTPEGVAGMLLPFARGTVEPMRSRSRATLVDLLGVGSFDQVEALAAEAGDAFVLDAAAAALDARIRDACGVPRPRAD